jgi:hypothetical protein
MNYAGVDMLKPGEETDKLVGKYVFRLPEADKYFPYSTKAWAAMMIFDRFAAINFARLRSDCYVEHERKYKAEIGGKKILQEAVGSTAEMALCRVGLKAAIEVGLLK